MLRLIHYRGFPATTEKIALSSITCFSVGPIFLELSRIVSHNKSPLNPLLTRRALVMIWSRERLVVSVYQFMSTDGATVYARPPDTVPRTKELVERINGAQLEVSRVFVQSHRGIFFRKTGARSDVRR